MICQRIHPFLIDAFCILQVDLSSLANTSFSGPNGPFDVEVFDSSETYVKLMK